MAFVPERTPLATLPPAPALLREEIASVEALLQRYSASSVEPLQEAARHILNAGGKRVRPQLLMLSALAVDGSMERAIPLAAATELIHTATLVHDDIVDEADSRRGRATVQYYFGNSAAVLMGDYLVVRAFGIVADDGEPRIWRILVDTIARMCEGEVIQISIKGDTCISLEVYETVIECKTAALMSACGRFGGFLGRPDPVVLQALGDFGRNLGMAFQIADDILDFTGEEATLGKPVGGDLREGKVTLPVIFALRSAAAADRQELVRLFERPGPITAADVAVARSIVDAARGFDRAREHALVYVDRARDALANVPPSPAHEALRQLADQVVDRRA